MFSGLDIDRVRELFCTSLYNDLYAKMLIALLGLCRMIKMGGVGGEIGRCNENLSWYVRLQYKLFPL